MSALRFARRAFVLCLALVTPRAVAAQAAQPAKASTPPSAGAPFVQPDSDLVRRFRRLLTSKNQVAEYQSFLYAATRLYDKVGEQRAGAIVEASRVAAYTLPRDSAALAALDRALAGHSFQAESVPPPPKKKPQRASPR